MTCIFPEWPAPTNIRAFTTTRGIDTASLSLPETPIRLQQTHSAIALPATPEHHQAIADACFTDETNRICQIVTADCLPLLICNREGSRVAAIHAGWRGLAGGIIESTLNALALPGEDLLVWLGPAIGPEKFEVGRDVYDAFTERHPLAQHAFRQQSDTKWLADIYQLATQRLNKHNITHIYGGNFCTFTQNDLFFSYRRDKGETGRMASMIWMEPRN
jgi:YfiH family protein